MNYDPSNRRVLAPCIIDTGIVVNKQDMQRLLADLGRVRYLHLQDGELQTAGEGYVMEVFADPQRSTLVANHALYLNLYSFDYLELKQSPNNESYLDLIQDSRKLRLIPLTNPLQERCNRNLDAAALEAMVTEMLSAKLDAEIDDDGTFPL